MELAELVEMRLHDPAAVAARLAARVPFAGLGRGERLLVIAADHPARGALGAGDDPSAMEDRWDLLRRIRAALGRPGVHGFLGTADLVEDLALLGALEGKFVLGSMNRGGLAGTSFELDDRFTGYDAAGIAAAGLDGGKMLLRIDPDDAGSVATIEACAHAVDELAERGLVALVEPFWTGRSGGQVRNRLDPELVARAVAIASGLGRTSAYTWLKLPVVADQARVVAASTFRFSCSAARCPRTPRPRSRVGVPRSSCRPSAGWRSAGRCSTPLAVTSLLRSMGPWRCWDRVPKERSSDDRCRPPGAPCR